MTSSQLAVLAAASVVAFYVWRARVDYAAPLDDAGGVRSAWYWSRLTPSEQRDARQIEVAYFDALAMGDDDAAHSARVTLRGNVQTWLSREPYTRDED